jgi:hypothetical protein
MILPMGWVESPQYLCAVTETIADVANNLFAQKQFSVSSHRLDALAHQAAGAPVPKAQVIEGAGAEGSC